MRVLVCSRSDAASVNVRDRVLELGDWERTGRHFRGAQVWSQSEAILIEVAGPAVVDEALDGDLRALGLPLRDVWFLSRHRAASGQPSLTVHPIGNHAEGEPKVGGRPATLSPAAPRDMGALLRRLRHHRDEAGLPHEVTYEATHHGPTMTLPSLFLEIGSDDRWYTDPKGGMAVALAVQDVLRGEGRCAGPVLVGVGGGHYHPRQTDVALAGEADFGHLVPAHVLAPSRLPGAELMPSGAPADAAVPDDGSEVAQVLARAVAATPGCTGVHIHRKGLKGAERQAVEGWCAAAGVAIWQARHGEASVPSGPGTA